MVKPYETLFFTEPALKPMLLTRLSVKSKLLSPKWWSDRKIDKWGRRPWAYP